MLDIFALVVIFILVAVAIGLVVLLGNLPGKMARDAGHPQADAIALLGWIGLLTLGLGWFVALVWARTKPLTPSGELEQRLAELEARVRQMEAGA